MPPQTERRVRGHVPDTSSLRAEHHSEDRAVTGGLAREAKNAWREQESSEFGRLQLASRVLWSRVVVPP